MASPKYDFKKIEKKWQKEWERTGVHKAKGRGKKWYSLIEFPYPSGVGLHVGHIRSNTAMDIISRKRRMEGFDVLYPIGWDAFGLPTENYAIKTGVDPAVATKRNTDTFRRQLKSLGFSFDWSREVNTTDPAYYKWTQWMFLQFFKKGLAYKASSTINWCPKDKIGLANEEAAGGVCDRCGGPVEKRMKEQWMIKITEYADKLLAGLNDVDYITRAKVQQDNWIGRSEGAEIDFMLNWPMPQMDVVFATTNLGKLKRMQKLVVVAGLKINLKMPSEIGVNNFDVIEDGATIAENAEKKARALAEHADLPVLADDGGFFINGVDVDPVTVKRNALGGKNEKSFTIEEIAKRVQKYYADIATSKGGKVDAEWRNALCFVTPEKFAMHIESIRPVTLTNESRGIVDPYLPIRGMYISKTTGKYALEQNEKEELQELQPITDALKKLFTPTIKVFTTRPDTIFGATYMVLAPEHPFVQSCLMRGALKNNDEVASYVAMAKKKTEFERTDNKQKTGVELKGVKAINPATKEEIPMFVADYVLGNYGTGAIMAVPAHDERDGEFAKKFGLEIKNVIEPVYMDGPRNDMPFVEREIAHAVVKHWSEEKYLVLLWKKVDWVTFVTGGVDAGEKPVDAAIREIKEETGYQNIIFKREFPRSHSKFYHVPKNQNVFGHFSNFYFQLQDGEQRELDPAEKEKHELRWVTPVELEKMMKTGGSLRDWQVLQGKEPLYTEAGILTNSGKFNGMDSEKAKWEIVDFVGGKRKIQYKLRDWVFSRQRYWGEPIPLVNCATCGWVAVPDKDLPVKLPKVKNYQPRDDGESPLASVSKWVNTNCPQCKKPAKRETDTMPNWAGSSWYFLRYADANNKKAFADPKKLKYFMPVDWYNGGMEHTVLHLLYSRFWNMFLHELGFVPVAEPYKKRTSHGLILAEGGEKMSKSKGNVLNPDDIVEKFGADSLRTYEMFMGPFEQAIPWDMKGIVGVYRFLERVWNFGSGIAQNTKKVETDKKSLQAIHRAIKKVSADIEVMGFNTAVSAFMICLNDIEKTTVSKKDFGEFLKLLSPFAPHMAQELWSQLGKKTLLDKEKWPVFDEAILKEQQYKLIVQVNGKVRDSFEVESGIVEQDALALALAREKVQAVIGSAKPKKVIFISGRLISIVI